MKTMPHPTSLIHRLGCLGSMLAMHSALVAAEPVLWLTDSLDRVMRDRPVQEQQVGLSAAQGEWESLQLVLHGDAAALKGAKVTAEELRGPNESAIAAPVVLREHYVALRQRSELAALQPGSYPDALVPQDFPEQELPAGEAINQPFWIDVYVPRNASPGDYLGRLTATLANGQTLKALYTLRVWSFELPKLPALQSSFFVVWRRIAEVHGFDHSSGQASPALLKILNSYYDLLVDHRVSPHEVYSTYPDPHDALSERSYEHMAKGLEDHLLKRGAGTISLPLWPSWPLGDALGKDRSAAMDYIERYYRMCEKLGCADRLYKIFGELDEPNNKEQYEAVRDWGKFFKELQTERGIKIPLLITEQPLPDNAEWGNLNGSVDIWSALARTVWEDIEGSKPLKLIPERLAAGEQIWTYSALVQAPEEMKIALGHPDALHDSHPPVWLTDFAPINWRIYGWLAPIHGITGLTYWDTSFWPKDHDVWADNGTYPHMDGMYNGDGFLIYPAHESIHGIEGPVASIRLKWIRDGMDDYDLIHLIKQRGFNSLVKEETSRFATGFGAWKNDPAALRQARNNLGDLFEKLSRPRPAKP
jgi:Domain of unknown function (DUF4091)